MSLGASVIQRARRATHSARLVLVVSNLVVFAACGGGAPGSDGGGTTPTTPSSPGLRIVAGGSGTDTISAVIPDLLTVEVIDASGRPAVSRDVVFETTFARPGGPGTAEFPTVLLGLKGTRTDWQITVPTDASGRAAAQVHLGVTPGAATVHITVPALGAGYASDAHYTVLVGAADHLVVTPFDSTVYVGGGYRLTSVVTDRAGNLRPSEPVAYSVDSGGATVDANGSLVATAVGRVRVVAKAGAKSGLAWMSVPPHAVVASQEHAPDTQGPLGIYLIELDGSNRTLIAKGIASARESGQGFSWSPDGRDLVLTRGDSVDVVTPGSAERALVKLKTAAWLGPRFSRDGAWIYFARQDSGLARVRRDGSSMQVLGYSDIDVAWRPSPSGDGLSLAYGSLRSPCGVQDCIRVMDIASGRDRAYANGKDFLVHGRNSAWSPVDDLIAYAWDYGIGDVQVGVIHADGTGQRAFSNDLYGVNWMDFSPDGKWLLVGSVNAPVTLFEVRTGMRLPLATLGTYRATAWRP
jgi:hypothetical protein